MDQQESRKMIENGNTALGIELGSTRIKAVLIGKDHSPIASGSFEWENRFEDGVWTYPLEDVWHGIQASFRQLNDDLHGKYGVRLETIGAIGISAMMHGYLPFDQKDELLVPFRTWRNTMTAEAAEKLTSLFQFNVPQRWSIAHLYQAILNREPHVSKIHFLTTLAGYVHWKLTGQKVLGVGEASGMFPIDSAKNDFDKHMLDMADSHMAALGFPRRLRDILPTVLNAGDSAGKLTADGAKLLDPTGVLHQGIPLCPPEGDAGTGMVATNSVAARTGNVSAGTSIFAMLVLEKPLSRLYTEIDMVTTPTGKPVAMVHSNNCTSDINAWIGLFQEFGQIMGIKIDHSALFEKLYTQALVAEPDAGGLLVYNYLSGEHITHFEEGRPVIVRTPESRFNLANFMRANLFSSLGALKIGLEILLDKERVKIDQILGHGGFFKTKEVGQRIMAAAMNAPISVMETAGEGGAWGIALLAAFLINKSSEQTLEAYLTDEVFSHETAYTIKPEQNDIDGFNQYMKRYKQGLSIERAAIDGLK